MVEIIRYAPGESGEDNTAQRQRILKMHNKKCHYNNIEYNSLFALARKLGVSKATVSRAIKKGEYRGFEIGLV